MKIKITAWFLIVMLCTVNIVNSNLQIELFNNAIDQNLSVYPYQDLDWPDNDTRFSEYLAFVHEAQNNLQENSVRRIVFNILKRYLKKLKTSSNVFANSDAATYKDLCLFSGQSQPEHYVANIINRSLTSLGFARLSMMLALPASDLIELKNKQAVTKFLIQCPSALQELVQELKKFQTVQNSLYAFWIQDPFKQTVKRRYFQLAWSKLNNTLNNNPYALTVRSMFDHQTRCIGAASLIVASVILPVYGVTKMFDAEKNLPILMQSTATDLYGSGGPIFGILKSQMSQSFFLGLLALGSGVMSALNVQESFYWAKDNFELDWYLDQKIAHLSIAFNCLKNIHAILDRNPELKNLLQDYSGMAEFFGNQSDDKVKKLVDSLKEYYQNKMYSKLYKMGSALVVFKNFVTVKSELEPVLVCLSEIDAFVGLALLYEEAKYSNNQYCFPEFCTDDTPKIQLCDFWNPLVQSASNVTNTIALGFDDNARGMVITGPNAGGKSTILKSSAISIMMAQGLGIIPAKSAYISIFDHILTYLNIVDDVAEGNSLFKNQVLRVQKIYSTVDQAEKEHKKCLIVLDEMFNGTSPKEAQTCAMSVAFLLAKASHASTILATHFHNLTMLPQVTDAYQNYHVSVLKNESGAIEYPFKLEPGISYQHVALDILQQEGFDNAFIEKAMQILVQAE